MKTITTKTDVYKFDELPDDVKEKAIENLYDINLYYDWWDGIYDDAENVGLKINEFDIDRGSYVKAEFIEDACFTANKIIENHGEMCETHKTAKQFLIDRDEIVNTAEKDADGEFTDEYQLDQNLDDVENEFLKSISEDYRIILTKEYEYMSSEKAIIETIEANEYDFTLDGKIF